MMIYHRFNWTDFEAVSHCVSHIDDKCRKSIRFLAHCVSHIDDKCRKSIRLFSYLVFVCRSRK